MIVEQALSFIVGLVSMLYGTFSGGAAILIIPSLLFFGVAPASAIATNRAVNFASTLPRIFLLKGKLNLGTKIPITIVFCHTLGSVLGGLILLSLDPNSLFKLVGVLLIISGVVTFVSKKGVKAINSKEVSKKSFLLSGFLLFLIGIYRGFFGPASGILGRLVLVQVLGLDFTQALTLATYYSMSASFFTSLLFLQAGILNFELGIPLAIGAIVGSFFGTKLAIKNGNLTMKFIFSSLAIIFGIYFILQA